MNTRTHPGDLLKVTSCINPQHLNRNVVTSVFAFPDISVPAMIQWGIRQVVTMSYFDRSWEQTGTTAHLAQSVQTLLLEPCGQCVRCLFRVGGSTISNWAYSSEVKERGSTSSIKLIKVWASSPRRRLTVSASLRSEKMIAIKETRSSVGRG